MARRRRGQGSGGGLKRAVLSLLLLVAAVALVMLLEPDVRDWLRGRGTGGPGAPPSARAGRSRADESRSARPRPQRPQGQQRQADQPAAGLPAPPAGAYHHDRFGTRPVDQLRAFEAFVCSFDGPDDDDGDGRPDTLRVPQWVAYELRRTSGPLPREPRPSRWSTDDQLAALGVAPTDESYTYPHGFRAAQPDWYVRGHLAARYHAQRLGAHAADATQTLLNAVPQRESLNSGAWLDLECLTGAWANEYGAVWIVTGPVFAGRRPRAYLGEAQRHERRVAVPDALFKVVVRAADVRAGLAVLGFVYPQDEPESGSHCDAQRFLASVDSIEALTGLDFLTAVPAAEQDELEAARPERVWPAPASSFDPACPQTRQCAELP